MNTNISKEQAIAEYNKYVAMLDKKYHGYEAYWMTSEERDKYNELWAHKEYTK